MLDSIRSESVRYRRLAEAALAQVPDEQLARVFGGEGGNSLAILVGHLAGNLRSRFTDILTADGEKPWRARDTEFEDQGRDRAALIAAWDEGWRAFDAALDELGAGDLARPVVIRGIELTVAEALHRSLTHTSYHVGQIVLLARQIAGDTWTPLSIPRGGSEAYNRNPDRERAL